MLARKIGVIYPLYIVIYWSGRAGLEETMNIIHKSIFACLISFAIIAATASCDSKSWKDVENNRISIDSRVQKRNDLKVYSVRKNGPAYVIMGFRKAYNITFSIPSLKKGVYSATGPGQGIDLKFTDATDPKSMKIYPMTEARITINTDTGLISGIYEAKLKYSETENIPVKGAFKIEGKKVIEK